EDMKFSAGHFTIFSATKRERLHGHNFRVYASVTSAVDDDGLAFDYGIFKKELYRLCSEWNEYFLLPEKSPHLSFEHDGDYLYAHFGAERIPFLKRDVLLLPISNVTLEELAQLILRRLLAFRKDCSLTMIHAIEAKVF